MAPPTSPHWKGFAPFANLRVNTTTACKSQDYLPRSPGKDKKQGILSRGRGSTTPQELGPRLHSLLLKCPALRLLEERRDRLELCSWHTTKPLQGKTPPLPFLSLLHVHGSHSAWKSSRLNGGPDPLALKIPHVQMGRIKGVRTDKRSPRAKQPYSPLQLKPRKTYKEKGRERKQSAEDRSWNWTSL